MFGRNERAFNSSVVCVVSDCIGEIIFQSGNSKGKNLFFRTFLYFLGRIFSIQCDNLVTFELWAGSSTCLYIFNGHSTTMNPMEEKERRPILKRWPLKLIEHFAKHYLHFAICRSNGQLSSERSQFNLSFRVRV